MGSLDYGGASGAASLALRVPRLPSTRTLSDSGSDDPTLSPHSIAAVPGTSAALFAATTQAVLLPTPTPAPISVTLHPACENSVRQHPASANPDKKVALNQQQSSIVPPHKLNSSGAKRRSSTTSSAKLALAAAAQPAAPKVQAETTQRLGSRQVQKAAESSATEIGEQQQQEQQPGANSGEACAASPCLVVATSRSPSRGQQGRPASASPARPRSGRLPLGERVARQMERPAGGWSVAEVADYVEAAGLGAYRRAFVHNAVAGTLFLGLTEEQIRVRTWQA